MLKKSHLFIAIVSVAAGIAISQYLLPQQSTIDNSAQKKEKQPLYWVAPMDSNYRRDKAGKSPMGMDLIPVYEEQTKGTAAGTVTISPQVVNNLGVRTAAVAYRSLTQSIETVGYVQYDEDKLVHIHPRVSGWIESLTVKSSGEPITKEQPLYSLYSPELVNAQEEYLVALNNGNKALILASEAKLSALHISSQLVKELKSSRKVKQLVTFYAPQSGVVNALKIREGFYVQPGNTVMSIAQLDHVWVEAEVFERDVDIISAGQKVAMTLDYLPGKEYQGVVDYIYPTLEQTTRTLRVRLKFENKDKQLKPNMFAQVRIYSDDDQKVLTVPKEAVIRTGQQDRVVVVLGDGQFKSVAVKLGRVTNDYVEISEGLIDTDQVVVSAQFLLDSESSKTSDFLRMTPVIQNTDSVWMSGVINSSMAAHSMVNISHEPSAEWDWPAMTMDFSVTESINFNELQKGHKLHFEVTRKDNNDYVITAIHMMGLAELEPVPSATVTGIVNQINQSNRIVNISREAIDKWDRPAATMDFLLAQGLETSELREGMTISFTFEIRDKFVVIGFEPVAAGDQAKNNQE